jgi:hypothetical protein
MVFASIGKQSGRDPEVKEGAGHDLRCVKRTRPADVLDERAKPQARSRKLAIGSPIAARDCTAEASAHSVLNALSRKGVSNE